MQEMNYQGLSRQLMLQPQASLIPLLSDHTGQNTQEVLQVNQHREAQDAEPCRAQYHNLNKQEAVRILDYRENVEKKVLECDEQYK